MIDNEDWPKRTWNLYNDGVLVTDLPGLYRSLGCKYASRAEQRLAVAHFVSLPAAVAMPATLRTELAQAYPALTLPEG